MMIIMMKTVIVILAVSIMSIIKILCGLDHFSLIMSFNHHMTSQNTVINTLAM